LPYTVPSRMPQVKKNAKRVNIRLAKDCYDMLAAYASENGFDMTYALEHLIRLLVPALRKNPTRKISTF
jgi:hypothetical protein